MSDHLKRMLILGYAITLYGLGAFLGAVGGLGVIVMGVISIFWGTPLVNEILIVAGISALGLTIAESGRRKLCSLAPLPPRYVVSTVTKHAN